jgi:hypothetical protein
MSATVTNLRNDHPKGSTPSASAPRSIEELTPLIHQDLDAGDRSFEAAGKKLLEARLTFMAIGAVNKETGKPRQVLTSVESSNFWDWAIGEFKRDQRTLEEYMARARGKPGIRTTGRTGTSAGRAGASNTWSGAEQAAETRALNQETEEERQKRYQFIDLSRRLVDVGFRTLALELHPDKPTGSKAAFQMLGDVREHLLRGFYDDRVNPDRKRQPPATPEEQAMRKRANALGWDLMRFVVGLSLSPWELFQPRHLDKHPDWL